MTEHTPYKVLENPDKDGCFAILGTNPTPEITSGNPLIARVFPLLGMGKRHAKFIARACNNHYKLIGTLNKIEKYLMDKTLNGIINKEPEMTLLLEVRQSITDAEKK